MAEIESKADVMMGKPVVAGTRITVELILEELAAGTTVDDAVGRLYELRALGYVERHGDGWKLTRQAMISVSPDRRSG